MSVTISTSYAGQFAGKYIAASLLNAKTISDNAITVLPNIKKSAAMKVGQFADIIRNADCDFQKNQGTLQLTEKVLTPKELQINLDICKSTVADDWEAAQMGFSAFDNLPPLFSDFVLARVAAEVASATETSIWSGTDTDGSFEGFKTKLAADSDVIDVVATDVTSANVVAEIGKVVDAIPAGVYGSEDLYIYCAQNVFKAYVRALGGFAATNSGVDAKSHTFYSGGELSFDGVRLYPTSGMGANEMVAARASNLFFGTGLLSDYNEVRVLDMAELDGSQQVRIIMRYTAGVQIGVGADCVLYT